MTRIKICGITSVDDAARAVDAGADAIGLIFWPGSLRVVEVATAQAIGRALPAFCWPVGLFVDATPAQVRGVA
ncbi:MAG: phosphoribosylanthranilate isomerase, partial [Luteitalea sp.]